MTNDPRRPDMLKRLQRHPAVQNAAAWLLGTYLTFVFYTTRWTVVNEPAARFVTTPGQPMIVTFWHEGLALIAGSQWLLRRRFEVVRTIGGHVLVSRHRDGRLIGEIVRRFGYDIVHASSSDGGSTGLRVLARLLKKGESIAITPDGPRGPRRVAAPGVGQLAAMTGAPAVAIGAATSRMKILPSWDRMRIPLPFARGVFVFSEPVNAGRDQAEWAQEAIAQAMNEACAQADRWLTDPAGVEAHYAAGSRAAAGDDTRSTAGDGKPSTAGAENRSTTGAEPSTAGTESPSASAENRTAG
ncbi:lysophospholipid acyltransferase family protein [Acetobacteraceae bacterium H6797]|nr:lysophospholipid acyltransferase family protein [Acetobacteraceae bacterium H6797]